MSKKRGRPEGASNIEAPVQDIAVSRCRKCGSTERTAYRKTGDYRRQFDDVQLSPAGDPYNVITWRRTQCEACGQWRKDKAYELVRGAGVV